MDIVLIIAGVIVVGIMVWATFGAIKDFRQRRPWRDPYEGLQGFPEDGAHPLEEQQEMDGERERILHSISDPTSAATTTPSNDNNGIAEQIRQPEQTNKHLQKLISDFFWFRVAIVVLLIFGGIGVVFN